LYYTDGSFEKKIFLGDLRTEKMSQIRVLNLTITAPATNVQGKANRDHVQTTPQKAKQTKWDMHKQDGTPQGETLHRSRRNENLNEDYISRTRPPSQVNHHRITPSCVMSLLIVTIRKFLVSRLKTVDEGVVCDFRRWSQWIPGAKLRLEQALHH
jgi:hypothetical protein